MSSRPDYYEASHHLAYQEAPPPPHHHHAHHADHQQHYYQQQHYYEDPRAHEHSGGDYEDAREHEDEHGEAYEDSRGHAENQHPHQHSHAPAHEAAPLLQQQQMEGLGMHHPGMALGGQQAMASSATGEKRPRGRPKGSLNRPKEPGAQTQKKKRKSSGPPALMTALSSATREQLVNVVLVLAKEYKAQAKVQELLPSTDWKAIEREVEKTFRQLYRSYPKRKLGPGERVPFKYIQPALKACKHILLKKAKPFNDSKQWFVLIDYLKFALRKAAEIPVFEEEKSNPIRTSTAQALGKMMVKAFQSAQFTTMQIQDYHGFLDEMTQTFPMLQFVKDSIPHPTL